MVVLVAAREQTGDSTDMNDFKTIAATLAILGSGTLATACDKKDSPATETPGSGGAAAKAEAGCGGEGGCGEGGCGAEGKCGGGKHEAAPDGEAAPDDGATPER